MIDLIICIILGIVICETIYFKFFVTWIEPSTSELIAAKILSCLISISISSLSYEFYKDFFLFIQKQTKGIIIIMCCIIPIYIFFKINITIAKKIILKREKKQKEKRIKIDKECEKNIKIIKKKYKECEKNIKIIKNKNKKSIKNEKKMYSKQM